LSIFSVRATNLCHVNAGRAAPFVSVAKHTVTHEAFILKRIELHHHWNLILDGSIVCTALALGTVFFRRMFVIISCVETRWWTNGNCSNGKAGRCITTETKLTRLFIFSVRISFISIKGDVELMSSLYTSGSS